MKSALINAPALAFPDYSVPFSLHTDTSALGLSAVLMQPDASGKNHPLAYASRTLNQAEANYSVTHQETLAIVWALKHFRDIILRYPITVFTDHAPVIELFNLTGRLARWYLTIQESGPTHSVSITSGSARRLLIVTMIQMMTSPGSCWHFSSNSRRI